MEWPLDQFPDDKYHLFRMAIFGRVDGYYRLRLIERPYGLFEHHMSGHHTDHFHQETDRYVAKLTKAYVTLHAVNLFIPSDIVSLLQRYTQTRYCCISYQACLGAPSLTPPTSDDEDIQI